MLPRLKNRTNDPERCVGKAGISMILISKSVSPANHQ
jgi:hypothetical protein